MKLIQALRKSKERTLWIVFALFMVSLVSSLGACGLIK